MNTTLLRTEQHEGELRLTRPPGCLLRMTRPAAGVNEGSGMVAERSSYCGREQWLDSDTGVTVFFFAVLTLISSWVGYTQLLMALLIPVLIGNNDPQMELLLPLPDL